MTKVLDKVFEDARSLPDAEQERLATEIERLVIAARQRAVRAMSERIERESPYRGLSEDMIKVIREDRSNWAFGPDREDE